MKSQSQVLFVPWRFYVLVTLILFIVAGLTLRMVDLSVIERGFLQHEGDIRTLRVINTPAFRGMMMDRNGNPLAVSTSVYSVWINPQEFLPSSQNINSLSVLLAEKPLLLKHLIEHEKLKKREFVYVKRALAPDLADKIKRLMLPGVYLQEGYKRYYPEGEVAAHIVGFTNIDDKGQEGLELALEQWLHGVPGKSRVIKDRLGRAISNVQMMQEEKAGNNIVLSIDRRIQYIAYRALMDGLQENVATSGTIIVLDTQTGEVLAMVNLPSFNPNNRSTQHVDVYRNRGVTDTFEPGSTMKAFSLAAALESGRFKPTTVIETAPGWITVGGHVVRDEHNNGSLTVQQILEKSSNVGATKMMLSLPDTTLWTMLHRVGFGEMTGIGFPGEQSGSLVKRPHWKPFALATLSFGYGMSATPIQLAQAYSIFANQGVKLPISLLKLKHPPVGERVMDAKVAKQMLALLESVTTSKGATGELARVPGYRVAGKTGTAMIAGVHGYQSHHYIASFIGIAPVTSPRLVVAVIIHDPHGKHHLASFVAAPIFEKVMEGSLRILNVSPDNLAALEKQTDTV